MSEIFVGLKSLISAPLDLLASIWPVILCVAIAAIRRAIFYRNALFEVMRKLDTLRVDDRKFYSVPEKLTSRGAHAERNLEETLKILEAYETIWAAYHYRHEPHFSEKKAYLKSEHYENYRRQKRNLELWIDALKDLPVFADCPHCNGHTYAGYMKEWEGKLRCWSCGWPEKSVPMPNRY